MKQVWIYVCVLACVGVVWLVVAPKSSTSDDAAEGFEELIPCAFLTSMDSKKSLYLSSNHQARFSDKGGSAVRWETGSWSLVDDDDHLYKIDVDGTSRTYTLVSAPEGEGCMLAAGPVGAADLTNSWFSALTDPK